MAQLTKDAAVRGGHGCCGFLCVKEDKNEKGEIITVLDTTNSLNGFYTGRLYPNKVVQITSGFTVTAEGTVTGTLETTNRGPRTHEFLNRYLSMYRRPGQAAQANGMEKLTDETSATEPEGAGGTVPIDEQLIALQFGGEFLNSRSENNGVVTWYIPVDVALVSLGNETASTTNAANTWGRKNWTLNGHVPANDIKINITLLSSIFKADTNDIGINIISALELKPDGTWGEGAELKLRAGVGKEEFILEVSQGTAQGF